MDNSLFEEYSELVSKFKSGDESAYEEIYKKSERMVYTICYGILNNEEDAFDSMQETYLTVYKKIDSLEDNKTFVSWLKRIATTKSLDAYKKKKGDVSYDDAVAADESLQLDDNLETLPDAYIMEKTKREALDKIIRDELTDVQYQTIHMHYYSQMSVEQIAEIMNCPVGTVKTRLKSSRGKIKEGVKKYEKDNKDAFAGAPGVPFLTRFFLAASENLTVPQIDISSFIGKTGGLSSSSTGSASKGLLKTPELTDKGIKITGGVLAAALLIGGGLLVKKQLDKAKVETVETSMTVMSETTVPVETTQVDTIPAETEPLTISVGDYIYYGSYEQDGDMSNGPEPIKWRVIDQQDDKILIISQGALEIMPMYDGDSFPVDGLTWENCTVRSWLNDEFYNTAFTPEEQAQILVTHVDNGVGDLSDEYARDTGNDTDDRIFIQANDATNIDGVTLQTQVPGNAYLFSDPRNRSAIVTDYAIAEFSRPTSDYGNVLCWTRTVGLESNTFLGLNMGMGYTYIWMPGTTANSRRGIRPMMWIYEPDDPADVLTDMAVQVPMVSASELPAESNDVNNAIPLPSVNVGDYITFGVYEQDNDLSNGSEPIEWRVLEVSDGSALLISRYNLEVMSYHTTSAVGHLTWDRSNLRVYLNGYFYQNAFSESERHSIITSSVPSSSNPVFETDGGQDTEDNVFILSLEEAQLYFDSDSDRLAFNTEYSNNNNENMFGLLVDSPAGWWLRTPRDGGDNTCLITENGAVYNLEFDGHIDDFDCGVRPVIRVAVQ